MVETPRANLVAGMKWFLGTYTMSFNRRHRLSGHLFAGRYKSLLLDEGDGSYLREGKRGRFHISILFARRRFGPASMSMGCLGHYGLNMKEPSIIC